MPRCHRPFWPATDWKLKKWAPVPSKSWKMTHVSSCFNIIWSPKTPHIQGFHLACNIQANQLLKIKTSPSHWSKFLKKSLGFAFWNSSLRCAVGTNRWNQWSPAPPASRPPALWRPTAIPSCRRVGAAWDVAAQHGRIANPSRFRHRWHPTVVGRTDNSPDVGSLAAPAPGRLTCLTLREAAQQHDRALRIWSLSINSLDSSEVLVVKCHSKLCPIGPSLSCRHWDASRSWNLVPPEATAVPRNPKSPLINMKNIEKLENMQIEWFSIENRNVQCPCLFAKWSHSSTMVVSCVLHGFCGELLESQCGPSKIFFHIFSQCFFGVSIEKPTGLAWFSTARKPQGPTVPDLSPVSWQSYPSPQCHDASRLAARLATRPGAHPTVTFLT